MTSKECIARIEAEGWYFHCQKGSHAHFKHPEKKGRVTINTPVKDLPKKTVKSILKQAGILD